MWRIGTTTRIRKITAAGVVTTLAGSGSYGGTDGPGAAASFAFPYGVAVGVDGTVYVADNNNHTIRKITAGDARPIVTTTAATAVTGGGATLNGTVNPNGFITTARFEYGLTDTYGTTAALTLSPTNGTTAQTVSAALTGLTAGTTYYYRLTATNVDGTATTAGTFTTTAVTVPRFNAFGSQWSDYRHVVRRVWQRIERRRSPDHGTRRQIPRGRFDGSL
jgi:hypothetical protein